MEIQSASETENNVIDAKYGNGINIIEETNGNNVILENEDNLDASTNGATLNDHIQDRSPIDSDEISNNLSNHDEIPVKQLRVLLNNNDVPLIYYKNIKESNFNASSCSTNKENSSEDTMNTSIESIRQVDSDDLPLSEYAKAYASDETIAINEQISEIPLNESLTIDGNVELTSDSDVEVIKIDDSILKSQKKKKIEIIDVECISPKRRRTNQISKDKIVEEDLILLNSSDSDNDIPNSSEQLLALFIDDGPVL